MPERGPEDVKELDAIVNGMLVRSVSVTFSAKIARKEGDDYRTFESSQSCTMRSGEFDAFLPEVAKLTAVRYSPDIIAKVLMDLHLGGVAGLEETKARIRDMRDYYQRLYQAMLTGGGGEHRSGVSGTGPTVGGAGDDAGTGADASAREAPGVPAEAGPDLEGAR